MLQFWVSEHNALTLFGVPSQTPIQKQGSQIETAFCKLFSSNEHKFLLFRFETLDCLLNGFYSNFISLLLKLKE